jgi:hypothetical protein
MKRLLAILIAAPLSAQSLASRVAAVDNGTVTFQYAARPGVCGDGETFVRTGPHTYHGSWSSHRAMEPCDYGPVQVRLTVADGSVQRVESWVGRPRSRAARDLGTVSATEAASYLMTIAQRGDSKASAKAIFPAVLADSATVWPALLPIARSTRSKSVRQDALFWLSRFATGALAGSPNNPFAEDDEPENPDDDLKKHAVFVMSQLPRSESVPQLIDIARTNRSWRVRSRALFWLGQSGDPRAIDLFEEVLRP